MEEYAANYKKKLEDKFGFGLVHLKQYVDHKLPPGGFLTGIITNDLKAACWNADNNNKDLIFYYVEWLYNYAPSACWGSYEKMQAYLRTTDETIKVEV